MLKLIVAALCSSLIQVLLLVGFSNCFDKFPPPRSLNTYYNGPQDVYQTYGVFNPVTTKTEQNTVCSGGPTLLGKDVGGLFYLALICCENVPNVLTVVEPQDILNYKCCGSVAYLSGIYMCCGRNLYSMVAPAAVLEGPVSALFNKVDAVGCCNDVVYNRKREVCCDNRLYFAKYGPLTGCCGSKPTRSIKDNKQQPNQYPVDSYSSSYNNQRYEPNLYNMSGQICCSDKVQDVVVDFNSFKSAYATLFGVAACCGSKAYSVATSICCGTNVVDRFGANPSCCGGNAYDTENAICCNGFVHKLNDPFEMKRCCGINSYDPKKQKCCGGRIVSTCSEFDEKMKCCGIESYDSTRQICCSGVILDADPRETKCCGLDPYNKRSHICCNQEYIIEKGKKCSSPTTSYQAGPSSNYKP